MAGLSFRPIKPWAGVLGGAVGWFVSQQAGATTVFAACSTGRWWTILLLGLAGLSLAIGGGLLSLGVARHHASGEGTRFTGLIGALVAALLCFPILMQTLGGLIVPECAS